MIWRLHGVFLVFLAGALAWNLTAARRAADQRRRSWELFGVLPLQLVCTLVLVRDRVVAGQAAWLTGDVAPMLFLALFGLALVQNVTALARRGARLTDIPIVLFNVGVGAALLLAQRSLSGATLGLTSAALVHDHVVLQALLGTHIAPGWTLCWHVPLLLRRSQPRSWLSASVVLLPAATAGFGVLLMAALHGSSVTVMTSFDAEPRLPTLHADLPLGVLRRPDEPGPPAPGDLDAWVLPADHDGSGLQLVRTPGRPLVVALTAPDGWLLDLPPVGRRLEVFADGAERLAALLTPDVLLPFPEPDGEAPLFLGLRLSPDDWHHALAAVAARVAAVSPTTRLALRLAGAGEASAELYRTLAPLVDVAGPRLVPGGSQRGGARQVDEVLARWTAWRADDADAPELWLLAVGASALAYGEPAQARFLEGCLARAQADGEVVGVLIEGWRDRGHTRGVARPDGTQRAAGRRLAELLDGR